MNHHGVAWFPLRAFLLAFWVILLSCADCLAQEGTLDNLLAGRAPIESKGLVRHAQLTDEKVPAVGSAWNTSATTKFRSTNANAIYDLGEIHVPCLHLLGL